MTAQQPPPMQDRMAHFRTECPSAGQPFPDVESVTLEGERWNLEALRSRVVVLETGSFT